MPLASLLEPLRHVALFQGLRPMQISEIAQRAKEVTFEPGEEIIKAGSTGDAAYVIVSGKVARTAGPGAKESSEALGPGTLVGEMAMLVETDYTSTVVCREQTKALKITRAALLEHLASDVEMVDHFVEKLSSRLQELANELRKVHEVLAREDDLCPNLVQVAFPVAFQAAAQEARQ